MTAADTGVGEAAGRGAAVMGASLSLHVRVPENYRAHRLRFNLAFPCAPLVLLSARDPDQKPEPPDVLKLPEEILVDRDGAVLTITLNRPEKYNALTFPMYARLAELCSGVPPTCAPSSSRALGPKAFAAGTDINQFRAFKSPEDGLGYEKRVDEILSAIEKCPVPVIAAIAGACTGGGGAIAACCDMRIGTRDMKFGFPIARTLGNCLSATSLQRLTALIGSARTSISCSPRA